MNVARKKTFFVVGIMLAFLTACALSHPTKTAANNTATGTPLQSPQAIDLGTFGKGPISDAAWSPDEKLLAVRSFTGIYLHNPQTWEVVKVIPERELEERSLGNFAFSPDGKNLVFHCLVLG